MTPFMSLAFIASLTLARAILLLTVGRSSATSSLTSVFPYSVATLAASSNLAFAPAKSLLLYNSLPIDKMVDGIAFLQFSATSFPSSPRASAIESAFWKYSRAPVLLFAASASAPLLNVDVAVAKSCADITPNERPIAAIKRMILFMIFVFLMFFVWFLLYMLPCPWWTLRQK